MLKSVLTLCAVTMSLATSAHAALVSVGPGNIITTGATDSQAFTPIMMNAETIYVKWAADDARLRATFDFTVDETVKLSLLSATAGPGNSAFTLLEETSPGSFTALNTRTFFPASRTGTLFSALSAGTYRFNFIEANSRPPLGAFSLGVTAVPVPGAGILLGSVLAGAGAVRLRRHKKRQTA